jgi:hypothetical protein
MKETKVKWTTVRVRPARAMTLADRGIVRNGETLMEVTCYGEPVAVVNVTPMNESGQNKPQVMWKAEGFKDGDITSVVAGAHDTIRAAQKAGVMPSGD